MKVVNQYIIPYKGLKEGEHNFDFLISEMFFEENSVLGIEEGSLKAIVVLHKKSNFLELDVSFTGNIKIQCDRCLDFFMYPVSFSGKLYIKFKEEDEEPDDNVMYMHPGEDFIILNQYFLDCIGLSIPVQKFHPDNKHGEITCNAKMISILDEYSSREQKNDDIDPRWSKLKDLLKDNNIKK